MTTAGGWLLSANLQSRFDFEGLNCINRCGRPHGSFIGMLGMLGWEALAWGMFGGFLVEGLDIVRVVRANGGSWPADCRSGAFATAELIRLAAGGGLAAAFGIGGEIDGPVGAIMIGVAAPLIVEKMSQSLPKIGNQGDDRN